MNKRNITACVVGILLVIGFISILIFGNTKKTFTENDIKYALTVDGKYQSTFPAKGMYRVDAECSNAKGKWDYDAWKLYVENVKGKVVCNISFTTIAKNNFNNYIINLSGTTQGIGKVVNEKGYRYEGQDPNNYVWFNNELWRIIGVFDKESHGQAGFNLVKIIRDEPIGKLVWDISGNNDWNTSSLKVLLNTEYLNSQNGTNKDYCYGVYQSSNTSAKARCDYTIMGIKDSYRGMIKEVTWYLGGTNFDYVTTEEMYGYERGTKTFSGGNPTGIGKIGLMYPSDYGYAAPAENCERSTTLFSGLYDNENCTLNNWLYSWGGKWTVTPCLKIGSGVQAVQTDGAAIWSFSYDGYFVQPTLYLESSVYVIDGSGSKTDPYIIGM